MKIFCLDTSATLRCLAVGWLALGPACNQGGVDPDRKPSNTPIAAVPECKSDSDCVPNAPCHATSCVVAPEKSQGSDGIGCAQVMVPGTLDGGHPFGCRCIEGRCGALVNDGCLVIGAQAPTGTTEPYRPRCERPQVPPGIDWKALAPKDE